MDKDERRLYNRNVQRAYRERGRMKLAAAIKRGNLLAEALDNMEQQRDEERAGRIEAERRAEVLRIENQKLRERHHGKRGKFPSLTEPVCQAIRPEPISEPAVFEGAEVENAEEKEN